MISVYFYPYITCQTASLVSVIFVIACGIKLWDSTLNQGCFELKLRRVSKNVVKWGLNLFI